MSVPLILPEADVFFEPLQNGLTRAPVQSDPLRRPASGRDTLSALFQIPPPFDDASFSSTFPPPPSHRPIQSTSQAVSSSQYLDVLTGSNYASRPSESTNPEPSTFSSGSKRTLMRKYPCPFPAILGLPFKSVQYNSKEPTPNQSRHSSPAVGPQPNGRGSGNDGEAEQGDDDDDEGVCSYWFKRTYDVERHLRSRHGIEMVDSKETLRKWYEELEKD